LVFWRENPKRWCGRALAACFVLFTAAAVVPYGARAETIVVFSVGLDKWIHFAGFGFMAVAAMGRTVDLSWWRKGTTVAGVALFGLAIETVQFFIPYRTFNPLDIVANLCGTAAGVGLWSGYPFPLKAILSKTGS